MSKKKWSRLTPDTRLCKHLSLRLGQSVFSGNAPWVSPNYSVLFLFVFWTFVIFSVFFRIFLFFSCFFLIFCVFLICPSICVYCDYTLKTLWSRSFTLQSLASRFFSRIWIKPLDFRLSSFWYQKFAKVGDLWNESDEIDPTHFIYFYRFIVSQFFCTFELTQRHLIVFISLRFDVASNDGLNESDEEEHAPEHSNHDVHPI